MSCFLETGDVVCGIIGVLVEGDGSGAPGGAKGCTAERAGAEGMGGIRMTRRPRRQFST